MRLLLQKWNDGASTYYAVRIKKLNDQYMCVVFVADNDNEAKIKRVGRWLVYRGSEPDEYREIELSNKKQHKAIKLIFTMI